MGLLCLSALSCFGHHEAEHDRGYRWFRHRPRPVRTDQSTSEASKASELTSTSLTPITNSPENFSHHVSTDPGSQATAQDSNTLDSAAGPATQKRSSPEPLVVSFTDIPDDSQSEIIFRDSSFFQEDPYRELPSPEELTERWGDRRQVIIIKELNLAIKRRFDLSAHPLRFEEAQTIRAIWKAFPDKKIPVPEVFGWRRHDRHSFLYMSLVEDKTLYAAWPSLTSEDKDSITAQLSEIFGCLRRVRRPPPATKTVCSINGGVVQDNFLRFDYEGGPFETPQAFNNWVFGAASALPKEEILLDRYMDGLYRDHLPDDGAVVFTHGDLHTDNIMVAGPPGSVKITAIIDWEQAGWYPQYWEYCKLKSIDYDHEWQMGGYADKIVEPYPEAWTAWEEYRTWRPFC